MKYSETQTLKYILKCGWQTAHDILNGKRSITVYQEELLKRYNDDSGDEYKIVIR